jgi:hypothetical protein
LQQHITSWTFSRRCANQAPCRTLFNPESRKGVGVFFYDVLTVSNERDAAHALIQFMISPAAAPLLR